MGHMARPHQNPKLLTYPRDLHIPTSRRGWGNRTASHDTHYTQWIHVRIALLIPPAPLEPPCGAADKDRFGLRVATPTYWVRAGDNSKSARTVAENVGRVLKSVCWDMDYYRSLSFRGA